jgi:Fe2+ transport system protein FeoA
MRNYLPRIFQRLAWPKQAAAAAPVRLPCQLQLLGQCNGRCLDQCAEGMVVEVAQVPDNLCCQQRLRELGIIEGETVRLLKDHDPMLLLAKDSRIAVERSMAHQIIVRCPAGK